MLSLAAINQFLIHYTYYALFPGVIVEGPIVTIIAGFLVSLGYLKFFLAYLVIMAGDLAGDTLLYAVGRWGRKGFVGRWWRFFGITTERLERLEQHFAEHPGKTLFFGKISHGIGGVFLVAAGLAHMPYGRFMWFNVLATVPKSFALLLVGYYFGAAYEEFSRYLHSATYALVVVFVVFVVVYAVAHHIVRRYAKG